jgi:hypothetical protein
MTRVTPLTIAAAALAMFAFGLATSDQAVSLLQWGFVPTAAYWLLSDLFLVRLTHCRMQNLAIIQPEEVAEVRPHDEPDDREETFPPDGEYLLSYDPHPVYHGSFSGGFSDTAHPNVVARCWATSTGTHNPNAPESVAEVDCALRDSHLY